VPDSVHVAPSIEDALEQAKQQPGSDEIFIIGGGQIYTAALPYTERLYLTLIDGHFDGDAFFPDYTAFTNLVSKKESTDENHTYTFVVLEK